MLVIGDLHVGGVHFLGLVVLHHFPDSVGFQSGLGHADAVLDGHIIGHVAAGGQDEVLFHLDGIQKVHSELHVVLLVA